MEIGLKHEPSLEIQCNAIWREDRTKKEGKEDDEKKDQDMAKVEKDRMKRMENEDK